LIGKFSVTPATYTDALAFALLDADVPAVLISDPGSDPARRSLERLVESTEPPSMTLE